MDINLVELLDTQAAAINSPDFIADDPVQFPRQFTDLRDIEITSLICSSIAWGNRKMICRNCQKILSLVDNAPYRYVIERGYEELPDQNIHRTFFAKNLRHFMRGLHAVYSRCGSLADYAMIHGVADSELPAWSLAKCLNDTFADANNGINDPRCLPLNLGTSALKRLNMALRWLVRRDGIVDMGVWDFMHPSQLYIPLDVHVSNTSRALGLLHRKQPDRRAVIELTDTLRTLRPDDPVYYDYALFGIGINRLLDTDRKTLSLQQTF